MQFDTKREVLTDEYYIYVAKDLIHNDFVSEVYLKCPHGIRHIIIREKFMGSINRLIKTAKTGYFSRRPYLLAQACDGSIGAPVYALFIQFCVDNDLSYAGLYTRAYNEPFGSAEWDIQFGEWQGVAYPSEWDREACLGLLKSLTDINNHALVECLEAVMSKSGFL